MPTNDIYEVRMEGLTAEKERWNIVTHFVLADNEETTLFETSQALADNACTAFGNLWLPVFPSASSFTSVRANRIWPSIGIPADSAINVGAGEYTLTEPLPSDIAAVVTKRSDFPGRSGRGRIYHPNLVEAQQAGGVLIQSSAEVIVDGWTAFAVAMQEDGAQNTWGMVIFSPKLAAEMNPTPYHAVARMQVDRVLRRMTPRGSSIAQRLGPTT